MKPPVHPDGGGAKVAPDSSEQTAEAAADEVTSAVATTIEQELTDVPPQARARAVRAVTRVVTQKMELLKFSGPIPLPAILREYDQIIPGAADRILKMAEADQKGRLSWYRSAMFNMRLGLVMGFVIGLSLVAGAIYCASIDAWGVALAFLGASAVGMVPALIKGWGDHRLPSDES